MPRFFEQFARSGQFVVIHRQQSGSRLLFFTGQSTSTPIRLVAAWPRDDGSFLYGVEAATPTLLNAAVAALQPS